MQLLKTLMGGSSQLSPAELEKEGASLLFAKESLEAGFKLSGSQVLIITSHRLLVLERGSFGSNNVDCNTIPYKSIVSLAVAGQKGLSFTGTIRITLTGVEEPLKLEFRDHTAMMQVYSGLCAITCGAI